MKNFFESSKEEVTRFVIVRHGRTQANQIGRIGSQDAYPLNSEGVWQAERLAERVSDFPITIIYCSPLLRTRQTAEPVARALGLPVKICPELAEYDFGSLSDCTLEELAVRNPDAHTQIRDWITGKSTVRPYVPGMENMDAFRDRLAQFIARGLEDHAGETVLVVTHMAVIKGMLAYLAGSPFSKPLPYHPDNASISVVDFFCGTPLLRLFNDTHHLGASLPYGRTTII